jgi:hypothetical protein
MAGIRADGIIPAIQPNRGDSLGNTNSITPGQADWGAISADTWNLNERPPVQNANYIVASYLTCIALRKFEQMQAKRKGETFEHYVCY